MKAVVYKYPITITDTQQAMIPLGGKILGAQEQDGEICLWALVDPHAEPTARTIRIVGTAHPSTVQKGKGSKPIEEPVTYIGTVQVPGKDSVVHVFEVDAA